MNHTEIAWLNHATVLLRNGDVGLLCDPWFGGAVFDDGWELLVEESIPESLWSSVTHIWISHEHPDHFHPMSLRSVPEVVRQRATVLYQQTRDKRVIGYLNSQGWQVQEVTDGQVVPLSVDCSVVVHSVSGGDSALLFSGPDVAVLNVNDCVLVNGADLATLKRKLHRSEVDVLLSQFSYAAWEGNPSEADRRRIRARQQLERVRCQQVALNCSFVVPFASFVRFAHEENAYMNDEVNGVGWAAGQLDNSGCEAVVLFPGDRWIVGEDHDNASAIGRWAEASDLALSRPLHSSPTVPIDQILQAGDSWLIRRTGDNRIAWFLWRRSFPGVSLWIEDHGVGVRLNLRAGCSVDRHLDRSDCDISLGSAALHSSLSHDWGGMTLLINGRFEEVAHAGESRVRRYWQLGHLNSRGYALGDPRPFVAIFGRRLQRWIVQRRAS